MNARAHCFQLIVECGQVKETVTSLFHTLLFQRTFGKFQYKQEGSYSVGTLGFIDVDCETFDFTYIRVASEELNKLVLREAQSFENEIMRSIEGGQNQTNGQISLEFFQRKKGHLFRRDELPWEVWTIKLDVVRINNDEEKQRIREEASSKMASNILYIADAIARHEYMPKVPNEQDVELVFDSSYSDIQPFLFRIVNQSNSNSSASVGTTMRKFFRDTLAL